MDDHAYDPTDALAHREGEQWRQCRKVNVGTGQTPRYECALRSHPGHECPFSLSEAILGQQGARLVGGLGLVVFAAYVAYILVMSARDVIQNGT